jgi:hypothetical protein
MAVAGACPGMVLAQIGYQVPNSMVTWLGGLFGALVYGSLYDYGLGSFCSYGAKVGEAKGGSTYVGLSLAIVVTCALIVVLLESFIPWTTEADACSGLPLIARPALSVRPAEC